MAKHRLPEHDHLQTCVVLWAAIAEALVITSERRNL